MQDQNKCPGLIAVDKSIEPIDPDSVGRIALPDGTDMPVAAYGTFHSDWAQAYMKDAIVEAIRIGWRHLDTARAYENEDVVGEAIREAISKSYINSADDLFITGKLWNGHMATENVAPALESTLSALGVDKIDLYLNHWPWPNVHTPGCAGNHRNPDAVPYIHEAFMETWGEMVKLKQAGKCVNIGVSNHTEYTLRLLLRDTEGSTRPVLNQMEMHPLFQQTGLRRFMESQGVICTGYMPLGSPNRPGRDRFPEHRADMADSTILAIAAEAGISPAQVCLNWAYLREKKSGGWVAMTTRSKYMRENLECATRAMLSEEQMSRISGDGTDENLGIDARNRLIWGQVFLWPETDGEWRVLWDDSQVFETRDAYKRFKSSWEKHHQVQFETTYRSH